MQKNTRNATFDSPDMKRLELLVPPNDRNLIILQWKMIKKRFII